MAPVNSSTPTRSGLATIKVTIKNYLDKDGNPVLEGTGGWVAKIENLPIINFKSVAGQTNYAQIPTFITNNFYASDVVYGKGVKIEDVLAINNGVTGINNATDTRVKIVSQSFNNKLGILDVDYT